MSAVQLIPLTSPPAVFLKEGDNGQQHIDQQDRLTIDALWAAEQASRAGQRDELFDGTILSVSSHSAGAIACQPLSYRFFWAQRKDSGLQRKLKRTALAVSGFTTMSDKVLIGRRNPTVTQYPGRLELIPSGSVDLRFVRDDRSVDYRSCLIEELCQELNSMAKISSITPLALALDRAELTMDVCLKVVLPPFSVIPLSSQEYSEITLIPQSDLQNFLAKHRCEFVPVSAALIEFSLQKR